MNSPIHSLQGCIQIQKPKLKGMQSLSQGPRELGFEPGPSPLEATFLALCAKVCIKANAPQHRTQGAGFLLGSVGSGVLSGLTSDIRRAGGWRVEGREKGRLVFGVSAQLTKRQEFSMLLQGDKVVKQVCGSSENNGECFHQKLLRTAGRRRQGWAPAEGP